MSDFITITFDDDGCVTCPMPAGETVVEAKLLDGSVQRAWFDRDIMESGDCDFVPVDEDDEPIIEGNSLLPVIAAWRPLPPESTS